MAVVAVRHIVPAQPGDGVQGHACVPGRPDHRVPGGFDGPNAITLLPKAGQGGYLAVGHGVKPVGHRVGVGEDAVLLPAPVGAGLGGHVGQPFPPCDDEIGLLLHLPPVGVAEAHPGILQQLGADGPPGGLPGLRLRVKPGVEAGVPVHGGVAHELPQLLAQLDLLADGLKLGVDHIGYPGQIPHLCHPGGGQGGGGHLQVVGGDGGHQKEDNPLDEVEHRRGQPIGLNPLPLLADVEILIGLHRIVEV